MLQIIRKTIIFALLTSLAVPLQSQDSIPVRNFKWGLSAYVEGFYSYDFSKPPDHNRPWFLYNFNRAGKPAVNFAFAKLSITHAKIRANLALATGTYVRANYAGEPDWAKPLLEANAGLKLSKKKDLWIDAGIFPSHIGFESATGKENWTLSRSMVAENSPYFETGIRLSYRSPNAKWYMASLLLNGWQRITQQKGSSLINGGIQVTYTPSEKLTLNYSNFVGMPEKDTMNIRRIYHNLYAIGQLNKILGIIFGFDLGTDRYAYNNTAKTWFTPVIITRIKLDQQWAIAFRTEYYADKSGALIVTNTPNGFSSFGASANVDFAWKKFALFRAEYRLLTSRDPIFYGNPSLATNNNAITLSAAFWY